MSLCLVTPTSGHSPRNTPSYCPPADEADNRVAAARLFLRMASQLAADQGPRFQMDGPALARWLDHVLNLLEDLS